MKNNAGIISKVTVSLLIIISILLSSPVYAEEMKLNSGETISINSLDNDRFEVADNVYSNGKLLFSKGTVASRSVGHIHDVSGNYHFFLPTYVQSKNQESWLDKHGSTVLAVAGTAAAVAVAVPVWAFYEFFTSPH